MAENNESAKKRSKRDLTTAGNASQEAEEVVDRAAAKVERAERRKRYNAARFDEGSAVKPAKKKGSVVGIRIGAALLWICAFACELMAVMVIFGKMELPLPLNAWIEAVILLVFDLIFIILGSHLWKKANHMDPVSERNKVRFWIWNNMGAIAGSFAFIPFILIVLTDKHARKNVRIAVIAAAVLALIIGFLCCFDWNPMSKEKADNAEKVLAGQSVCWTSGGQRYHLDQDCPALASSANIYVGSVDEAIENYGKDYLCKFCMWRNLKSDEPIEGIESLVQGAKVR